MLMNLYDKRSFAQNGRFSISPPGLFCPPADTVGLSAVPEPSTLVMLLTAGMMGGVGYWRRRRRPNGEKQKAVKAGPMGGVN